MLPDPLHPAVVHLPLALAVLVPLFAGIGVVVIHRGTLPRQVWGGVVLLALLLVVTAWASMVTGEWEEDLIKRVVPHELIEPHEDAADVFTGLGLLTLLASAVGLLSGRAGRVARGATVVLAVAALVAGIQLGRVGWALVYEHGASSVYTNPAPTPD